MEYKVRIVYSEVFEGYIEASNEEEAERIAKDRLNEGELDCVDYRLETTVE